MCNAQYQLNVFIPLLYFVMNNIFTKSVPQIFKGRAYPAIFQILE